MPQSLGIFSKFINAVKKNTFCLKKIGNSYCDILMQFSPLFWYILLYIRCFLDGFSPLQKGCNVISALNLMQIMSAEINIYENSIKMWFWREFAQNFALSKDAKIDFSPSQIDEKHVEICVKMFQMISECKMKKPSKKHLMYDKLHQNTRLNCIRISQYELSVFSWEKWSCWQHL